MFQFLSKLTSKLLGSKKKTPLKRPAARTRLGFDTLEDRIATTTTQVTNTLATPLAKATVQIESFWDTNGIPGLQRTATRVNGQNVPADLSELGTGAMISRNDVLTAGHAIFKNNQIGGLGRANWVFVSPARNGVWNRPFGEARSAALYTPNAWQQGDINSDIGLIRLDRNLGNFTGTLHYGWIGAPWLRSHHLPITVQHYPGNRADGSTQFQETGTFTDIKAKRFSNGNWNLVPGDQVMTYSHASIPTASGSSGAPVTVSNVVVPGGHWGNVPTIIAVHARGFGGQNGAPNEATLITPNLFSWIQNTMRNGPNNLVDRADLMDYDFFFQQVTSRIGATTARPGGAFYVDASLWNGGTATPGAPIRVRFFLSRDRNIGSPDDIRLGNDVLIQPGTSDFQQFAPFNIRQPAQGLPTPARAYWTGNLPTNLARGTYFVGWVIDPQQALQDIDRTNNSGLFMGGTLTIL